MSNRSHQVGRSTHRGRRGVALFIVMMFIVAIGVMALTAIVTTGNASLVAKSHARENDLRYAAEAALAIGKSRINFDAQALPDTGYTVLMTDKELIAADNVPIPGVRVTVYAGPSGSTSGQFGRFASIVAVAKDNQGNGFIRRLELTQESFAKYAYWTNKETLPGGGTIVFASGDQLWGPVWSNDVITIASSGATFHDDVATAKTISGAGNGTFKKGYKTNQKPISLPSTADLNSKLAGFATAGGLKFTAPTAGSASTARMRIEFVAVDLNADGDTNDPDEGFFKVYEVSSGNEGWLRGDYPSGSPPSASAVEMCGDWHPVTVGGPLKFFPASVHNTTWARNLWVSGGMSTSSADSHRSADLYTIMNGAGARCYLGGSPQLAATARNSSAFTNAQKQIGGDDTTFTFSDKYGSWKVYSSNPPAILTSARPIDARYLFPLHRSINTGSKGVIHVTGTVGVSGVLRGSVTLFSTTNIVILDDLRYVHDPATGLCKDMLGLLGSSNVVVADNALNTPQRTRSNVTKNVDDTKDVYIHGVMMALNTSFTVENYNSGPSNVNDCEGSDNGRGCLYLAGGLIQENRGPVGLVSGEGFVKRYSYDRCAVVNPPPYFPTTGRFLDNRYYELNPVGFNATALYKAITPGDP